MANKTITELPLRSPPFTGGEVSVVDDGTTTYQADLRYWGLSSAAIAYNPDGTVASVTKAGRTMTFTWLNGRLESCSDGFIEKNFGYDAQDRVNTITIS